MSNAEFLPASSVSVYNSIHPFLNEICYYNS
jgi:hypothetical protein